MPPRIVKGPKSLIELVGRELEATDWFVVAQDRIALFAEATEDRQWIHLNQGRAKEESPYGTTIAHGFLTVSLVSHFLKSAIQIESGVRFAVNYGLNRVRFPAAVHADSRIRARVALLALKELAECVEATYSITIEREQSEKPACVAEWIVRYYF